LRQEAPAILTVANRPLAAHALNSLARRGAAGGSRGGDGSRTGLDLRAEPVVPDAIDVWWLEHEAETGLWDILCRLEDFLRGDPFVLHLADSLSRSCLHLLLNAPAAELDCRVLVRQPPFDDGVVELARRRLGGRLEASVVGLRARVFRDFRPPKALRLNVGDGAQVSLA
jgi:hypothetical protein